MSVAAPLPLEVADGPRECLATDREPVYPERIVPGASGMRDLRLPGTGVLGSTLLFGGASDNGGEGGVGASDAVSDFGGGVDAVGEEGVAALASLPGLLALKLSTASGLGFLDLNLSIVSSANLNFSNVISLSTFKSPNSSLNRWVSILRPSRSCSPLFNSPSINTPLSIATLYLLSISSKLDSVFLACRS